MTTNDPNRPDDESRPDAGDEPRSDRKPKITRIVPESLRDWWVADANDHDEDLGDEWETIWTDVWQPLDLPGETLDGEATVIEPARTHEAGAEAGAQWTQTEADPAPPVRPPIADHHDSIIVAGLDRDRLTVNPGMTATFQVRLLNNGRKRATFGVHVEGWIDERWISVYPVNTQLQPGEQATLTVVIAPPRLSTSPAGDHAVAFVVRSVDYPNRLSRLGATLTINPFDEVVPGELLPRRARVSWHQQTASIQLPVNNRGNRPVTVRVWGRSAEPACRFEFIHPESGVRQPGECLFNVPPGQSANVAVRITPDALPLVSLNPQMTPYWLSTSIAGEQRTPREVRGQLSGRPLLGLWQLFAAAALIATALLMVALIGMGGLFTVQMATRAAQPAPIPEPAVVAIMLNMEQPAPTGGAELVAPIASAPLGAPAAAPIQPPPAQIVPATSAQSASQPAADQTNAPIVQANQVSAPGAGQPAPALIVSTPAPQPVQPVAAPPAQADEGMTYSAMFQEIGRSYDLDWRMLAAQAYVESNFDAVALGQSGDLGLMQILPGTWREWAPTVGATDPFDSYGNVLVAAAYLNYLRDMFGQRGYADPKWMLVAYNWGPDKLLAYLNRGQKWEELDPGLRRYAEDVLGIAAGIPLE